MGKKKYEPYEEPPILDDEDHDIFEMMRREDEEREMGEGQGSKKDQKDTDSGGTTDPKLQEPPEQT
jgi:hypothetical protein